MNETRLQVQLPSAFGRNWEIRPWVKTQYFKFDTRDQSSYNALAKEYRAKDSFQGPIVFNLIRKLFDITSITNGSVQNICRLPGTKSGEGKFLILDAM